MTATGRDEILAYGKGWVDAFSDAAYPDVRITDAGNTVMLQFNGQGVNDGAFGTFAASGKRVSFPTMNLTQLGHVPVS